MIVGNGVDIIEVRRVRQAIERWGSDFLNRVFTDTEIANAKKRVAMYEHLAGRFAAKEAISKALNDSSISWRDIEILNESDGKPVCAIRAKGRKKVEVLISISHVKNYAVASAVVTQKA